MVRSAEAVILTRSPQEVFRFVADLRNEPRWHTGVDSVPPGTGRGRYQVYALG